MTDPVPPAGDRYAEVPAALGQLNRSANASIRGYLTQVVYTALSWLDLTGDEVLVVEGREDIDKMLLDTDGRIKEVNEVQLKDLSSAVNARSEAVWESIFNFLLSYQYHQGAGRPAKMLFATTASLKGQTVAGSTGLRKTAKMTRLDLEVDVISTWASLAEMEDAARSAAVSKLACSVRGLFDAYLRPNLPGQDETEKSAEQAHAESVLAVIDQHDADSTWAGFFGAVSWLVDLDAAHGLAKKLQGKIAADPRLSGLPDAELAQVLIYRVLSAASQDGLTARFLTSEGLEAIAEESADSLRRWAGRHGLVHLSQWQLVADETLINHGERLDELESAVATAMPTLDRARSSISDFTRAARRRVRVEVGGVHVNRQAELTALDNILKSARAVVVLGASGAGKSALVKNYTERLESDEGLTLWLGGASLERPDLAALQTDISCGLPLQTVFGSHPGLATLVIDGLDRVFTATALTLLADLLDALGVGARTASCDLVVTCQTPEWRRLESALRRQGVAVSGWSIHVCSAPSDQELKPVWDVIPAAQHLALEPRLAPLFRNLKVLDLVASQQAAGTDLDATRFVGESSVAAWFWDLEVASGTQRRAREAFAMRLGELQADQLRLSVSLADLQIGGTSILDELEADRVCVVDERSHVLFAHDLFADWARLRILQSRENDLATYLRPRVDSPLWHRAIRLLGAAILDERNDVDRWRGLFGLLQEVGGDSAADLLLESIVFAANAPEHLELLAAELLAPESVLLDRLLGRFLAFATLPDPRMREIGRSVGMSDAKVSAFYRYPNSPYWPAVIRFLHRHRDRATKAAPRRVAQVVKLWLEHTPAGTGLRRETGEIGLLLGRLAIDERWSLRDIRTERLSVALGGVPECEVEVVEFALAVAERTTQQRPEEPSRSIIDRMHPDFDPNEPMPPPAPDGPRNRVDEDFAAIVLRGQAIMPLMRRRPAVASEIILACLLAPRRIGELYRQRSDEWDIDLAFSKYRWTPAGYFRGPFAALLQVDYKQGLDTIARLVDFVAAQWVERRRRESGRDQYIYDADSPGQLHAEIGGVQRTFSGDGRTLGWSAGLGWPIPSEVVTSALMALEQHLYTEVDTGVDVVSKVRMVLDRAESVPFLHVLLDVGRKVPTLFEGPLLPLLGIPELYDWESTVRRQGRASQPVFPELHSESAIRMNHEFQTYPHRKRDLSLLAVQLFFTKEVVSEFLTTKAAEWAIRVDGLKPGRERDLLQQRQMMFIKGNYKFVNLPDNRAEFMNVALQERAESMREERTAHNESVSLSTLPLRCRRLLDEEERLADDDLEAFIATLKRVELAWTKHEEPVPKTGSADDDGQPAELTLASAANSPAHALTGGIAVLLCLHYEWVAAQPDLLEWCRDALVAVVVNPPLRHSRDVHESLSPCTWDNFAVEGALALWRRSPEEPGLRRIVAILAFSHHNAAVTLLMRGIGQMVLERFADLQRLRRLVFENAHIRNRHEFVRQLAQYPDEIGEEEIQQEFNALNNWYQKQVEDFGEASSDTIAIEWANMDSTGIFADRDDLRRQRFGGYLLDFKLLRAAHESAWVLDEAPSAEERAYRVWFLKAALDFWTTQVTEVRREDLTGYPGEDACWLLDRLAAAIRVMTPEEMPEEIWERLVNLPTDAHHWAEVFLDSFFRQGLAADPVPDTFSEQIQHLVDCALALRPDQRWTAGADVWQALYGVHQNPHELWKARHAAVAARLWPLMQGWVVRDPAARTVGAVARWLTTEAAAGLRLEGLSVLSEAVRSSGSWRSKYDRKSAEDAEDAEDAVADALQSVWEEQETAVRESDDVRASFQSLLRWLGDSQHPLGLELLGRIGRL
jgi:ABC-type cobalamin/Fe3+-siderophores transport system ATPase subunit